MPYCKKCGSELSGEATYCPKCGTAVEAGSKLHLARWGERFVAWLIDVIILSAIIASVRFFTSIAWLSFTWTSGFPTWIPFGDFGLSNVIHFLYWMLMEGTYGQSFGKMVMRIKVTKLDGKPADIEHIAIESVGKAFLLPLDCLLGWILHPAKRQRIFNYLSETIVTKT